MLSLILQRVLLTENNTESPYKTLICNVELTRPALLDRIFLKITAEMDLILHRFYRCKSGAQSKYFRIYMKVTRYLMQSSNNKS